MNTLYLIRESWSATHSILHRNVYLDFQSRTVRANRGTWVWPLTAGNPDTRRGPAPAARDGAGCRRWPNDDRIHLQLVESGDGLVDIHQVARQPRSAGCHASSPAHAGGGRPWQQGDFVAMYPAAGVLEAGICIFMHFLSERRWTGTTRSYGPSLSRSNPTRAYPPLQKAMG